MFSFFTILAATNNAEKCSSTFLGLKSWFYYLDLDSACKVQNFDVLGPHSSLLLIGLAVVDDLLRIAGLVAVIYAIYAGIKYIMSQGSPDEVSKAQSTLINSLVGLAIAIIAVGLVSFIGYQLGTQTGTSADNASGINISVLPHTEATQGVVETVLKIVFGIVGALALLLVTIGGVRYVLSNGDPQATTRARNTILYALVGLVIALLGQVLVSFVIGRLTS